MKRLAAAILLAALVPLVGTLPAQVVPKEKPKARPGFPFKGKFKDKVAPKEKAPEAPVADDKAAIPADDLAFFEKRIRPVLVAQCQKCHSSETPKPKAGLTLDTREGTRRGGESGPAVVPGHPEKSLLIKAIRHADDNLKMPRNKMSDDVIADFTKWVKMGAPDPRGGKAPAVSAGIDIEKARADHWAYRAISKPVVPTPKDASWHASDIDRFVAAAREAKGLRGAAEADRRTLIRRLTFDLHGLPPSPAEIEAFVADSEPDAVEKLVDRLLASERFGERWGRHWLDVARYAETSGKQVNFNYPHAWRYRDYVVAAFNADTPYDRFLAEQVAGDLLPAKDAKEKAKNTIATGFLAVGTKPHNERNRLQFEMDVVDEQIDALTQATMGLTVSCARCHDHKFDPIEMKDYYALAGVFRSTQTLYGTIRVLQNNHPGSLATLPADCGLPAGRDKMSETARAGVEKQLESVAEQQKELRKEGAGANLNRTLGLLIRSSLLKGQLDLYEKDGTPKMLAMGAKEKFRPVDSPMYSRGEVDKPTATVPRGFVRIVSKNPPKVPSRSSGRLELAKWLVQDDNPLTARVMVNRVWLHLFGRAIVPSVDNFGMSGRTPSHPELLDHLATTFRADGWSVKKLIRRVVLSKTYRQASTHDGGNAEVDPENVYLWRMSKRRLDAESLRDSMLAVSGSLDLTPPTSTSVSRAGDGFSRGPMGGGMMMMGGPFGRGAGSEPNTRTMYLPVVRDSGTDALNLFDFADSSVVVGERPTTTVPSQSLYLMNNPFVIRQAEKAAEKLFDDVKGDDKGRIKLAYKRFFGREATEREVAQAEAFLAEYAKQAAKDGTGPFRRGRVAWAALCQAMMGSAEFMFRG